jgi:hypothetical protein
MKRAFYLVLMVAGVAVLAALVMPSRALAVQAPVCQNTNANGDCVDTGTPGGVDNVPIVAPAPCVKIAIPIFSGTNRCVPNDKASGGAVVNYLRDVLKLLSGAVGIVIILMLVIAGIQYITSVGDPARIKAAKNRVTNAIIALVLFLMMFAILGFLIPGGIL